MIVEMTKVRVLGRRADLPEALRVLQDLGALHVVEPSVEAEALKPRELSPREKREASYLRAALEDIDSCLAAIERESSFREQPGPISRSDVARWARSARRLRRRVDALERWRKDLEDERSLILKYREVFAAFQSLFTGPSPRTGAAQTYCLVLQRAGESVVDTLRANLRKVAGESFEMRVKTLDSGEAAVLLSISPGASEPVEDVLKRAGVEEVPVPPSYGGQSLVEAIPQMMARLETIPSELAAISEELQGLAAENAQELLRARAALHDRARLLDVLPLARLTRHAFVIDGWIPEDECPALEVRLDSRFEHRIAVEPLAGATRTDGSAPVALRNPRLFKPFEVLVRFVPLPRYGTMDPTPFLAVFFPMFFGLMLGDVGHGMLLGLLAWIVHRRAEPGGTLASLAKVAGACAAFAVLFGFLFGEFFGDLGHTAFGMPSLLFRREEALLPFLGLALAIGFVHILLGLILGFFVALRGKRREALGRGVAAGMIVLILLAILAATDVLPGSFFTPTIVAILVAFPVLVIAEGILAPIELLTAVSNIFSYARIMAIGTASVMMAIVANRMVGAVGSVVVGVLFALVFHLVNFVLGVFGPTIHGLRLHYVEFFGKFYRPGGADYQPLRHWQPNGASGDAGQSMRRERAEQEPSAGAQRDPPSHRSKSEARN